MVDLATRMANLLLNLRRAVAEFIVASARPPHHAWIGDRLFMAVPPPPRLPPLPAATWNLFHNRLLRLAERFQALHVRWRANTLPRPRPPRQRAAQPRPPVPRLPAGFAWANLRIPAAAPSTGQLRAILQQPDTREFVAAAPQAGRLLRPLCRALGVRPPPWLALPPRPRTPSPRRPPPQPALRPRAPFLLPTDHPIPRNILDAARAWKRKSP
jgi:hypothetical protein